MTINPIFFAVLCMFAGVGMTAISMMTGLMPNVMIG